MGRSPVPARVIRLLVAAAVVLPIAICVVLGVGSLLGAMDDAVGAGVMRYIAWGAGCLWTVDLICLVVAQGLQSLDETDEPPDG